MVLSIAAPGPAEAGAAPPANETRCAFDTSPAPDATETSSPQASRLPDNPKPVRFARADDRGQSDRTIVVQANPPLAQDAHVSAEVSGDLDKEDAGDSFDEEGIVVQRSITPGGDLKLKVCIDPEHPEHVAAGRYVGTIRITGRDVQATGIAIEVTMRKSSILAIVLLFVGAVAGILAKAVGDKQSTEKTVKAADRRTELGFSWWEYFKSGGFIGGFVGGFVLCVLAYVQIYAADPDWGTPLDMATLGLAAAAALVSGRTLADVVAPYVPQAKKPPAPAG